jgi:hypothetical protein
MSGPIKAGDAAIIIAGALGDKGPNIGKRVTVGLRMGEHSQHGVIWRVHGAGLTTEYGATGSELDCAQAWLQKIDPVQTSKTTSKVLEAQ